MPSIFRALKTRVMTASRKEKLAHFYSLSRPGQSVLDVGVSAETKTPSTTRNYFLKHYRYEASSYTGLGVQDLSGMERQFPGKRFVIYPGGRFPFADKSFDWVFSNAVIEHVGDDADQVGFVNEMLRVAANVFFTTPNKFFPIESHTNVVFLHWHDDAFYAWAKRKRPWLSRRNLYLFSHRRLRRVVAQSNAVHSEITVNRALGWPMTFTVVCDDGGKAAAPRTPDAVR